MLNTGTSTKNRKSNQNSAPLKHILYRYKMGEKHIFNDFLLRCSLKLCVSHSFHFRLILAPSTPSRTFILSLLCSHLRVCVSIEPIFACFICLMNTFATNFILPTNSNSLCFHFLTSLKMSSVECYIAVYSKRSLKISTHYTHIIYLETIN